MGLEYVHLRPNEAFPQLPSGPLRVVIISETTVSDDWRNSTARWLVNGGCLYAVAWGTECEKWHDAVDWAVLETFDYGDIPDDKFVMTTWHDDEPLSEALWFAGNCAFHPDVELQLTLVLHVADEAKPDELIATYAASQTLTDE
jgi:hypothetical protein